MAIEIGGNQLLGLEDLDETLGGEWSLPGSNATDPALNSGSGKSDSGVAENRIAASYDNSVDEATFGNFAPVWIEDEPATGGATYVAAEDISSASSDSIDVDALTPPEGFFERDSFNLKNAGQAWSYAYDGTVMRFEVRGGDQHSGDIGTEKERSEIASLKKMNFDRTYTIDYEFMIESGSRNTAEFLILGQIHQTEDEGDLAASPPFCIQMVGEKMQVAAFASNEPIMTVHPPKMILYTDQADIQRDRWYKIEIEVRMDPDGLGFVNVSRDGVQIASYTGALGYNDQFGPYWAQGIYRETSPETYAVNYRNLVVGAEGLPAPVIGTAGDDDLFGGWESEKLFGSSGNDKLNGGVEADEMYGGAGDDSYLVDNIGDLVSERENGVDAGGLDLVRASISYTLGDFVEDLTLIATGRVNGTGNDLANKIYGQSGVNILSGRGGDDTIFGEGGDDTSNGDDGADKLYGGLGNDTLNGGAGNDALYGEDGEDELYGNDGNDTLNGHGGVDVMAGGAGNDNYYVDNAADKVVEAAGGGIDVVDALVRYNLDASSEVEILRAASPGSSATLHLSGNIYNNTIYGNAGTNILKGYGGHDALWGRAGTDTLRGMDGVDKLYGGIGNDIIYGGTHDDLLYGDEGDDTIRGEENNDRIWGGADNDIAFGNLGDDTLYGEDGDDKLYGSEGNDILLGGAGADRLAGEAGNDVFYVDRDDVVVETVGGGSDLVYATASFSLSSLAEIEILRPSAANGTASIWLTGNDFVNVIYGNAGNNILSGRGGDDTIRGENGNDTLNGDDGLDKLYGGLGNDTLNGGNDSDSLYGEDGIDTLNGGAGNDRLEGGRGGDTMYGGAGDDTYYVDGLGDKALEGSGGGTDRVYATASCALSSTTEVEMLRAIDAAATTAISLTGSDSVNSIYGNAGANTLNGKGGVDSIYGYGGNDIFVFSSIAQGGDRIADFGLGNDTFHLDNTGFGPNVGTGSVTAAGVSFVLGATATAANETLIYNKATGQLLWDVDGTGAGAAELVAFLANKPDLTVGDDFLFI